MWNLWLQKMYDNKFFSPLSFVAVFGSGIQDPRSGNGIRNTGTVINRKLLVRGTDPRIRIHTKMSRVRNNGLIWCSIMEPVTAVPLRMIYGYEILYGTINCKYFGLPKFALYDFQKKLFIFLSLAGVAFKLLTKTEIKTPHGCWNSLHWPKSPVPRCELGLGLWPELLNDPSVLVQHALHLAAAHVHESRPLQVLLGRYVQVVDVGGRLARPHRQQEADVVTAQLLPLVPEHKWRIWT